MSKVDLQENTASSGAKNKLKAKDLIFAGAFGAIYLVLMLIIVMGSGMIPILYFLSPLTVGLVCGTVYVLCVLKIRKFGAALILGVLFALVACSNGGFPSIAMGIGAALLAELILFLGKYRSRKMFLLSFVRGEMVCAKGLCGFSVVGFSEDHIDGAPGECLYGPCAFIRYCDHSDLCISGCCGILSADQDH